MMVNLGRFLFRYRNGLFPLVFAVALFAGEPQHAFGRPDTDFLLDLAGAAIALAGQALRMLTIGYEYIVRGGKDRKVYADNLVKGGIFAHCRNPLYVGNLLIAFGLAIVIHSFAFYVIFLPFIVVAYVSIVAAEEEYLRTKFGAEYERYCASVNRWWPRWSGYAASTAGMYFNWKRVLIKEYNTTFMLIAGLIGLDLWTEYLISGPSALPTGASMAIGIAVWVGSYALVRALKKSGFVRG
jgi:protein-S-isoprenylcysteine O-methyltransferase Ste14